MAARAFIMVNVEPAHGSKCDGGFPDRGSSRIDRSMTTGPANGTLLVHGGGSLSDD